MPCRIPPFYKSYEVKERTDNMGMFLDSRIPFDAFKSVVSDIYFVDKSDIVDELIPTIGRERRFVCITRPRRFGKSVMANMIAAYFGNMADASMLFDGLKISKSEQYQEHLNQYSVIFIDFSEEPENCRSYEDYINRIINGIKADLAEAYPEIVTDLKKSVWDILTEIFQKTDHTFVFIMDEWDAVFHMPYITEEDKEAYLRFLKLFLKGKRYVALAYMTGVLPIAKYSSGSELNMFVEYGMATSEKYSEYFGFLDMEVDAIYEIYRKKTRLPKVSRDDLRVWYDGYDTADGKRIYNPRSIVMALSDNQLRSYWTSSGPYDEIFYYIRNNLEEIRDDLVMLISGEGIETEIRDYAAVSMNLESKDEIYSAMVVYGLLTYRDGKVYIPNREIMEQFRKLLMTKDSLGYVYRLAKESEKMLKATLAGDTETMTEILQFAHDTESPILSYNSEIELSAVVNLIYLAARDKYRVEREDKAGKGYVDFIFYPERKGADCIILELKVNSTPGEAISQIKDKNYALRFRGKLGEAPRYTGRIVAVGIGYSTKTKEHACEVEVL